MATLFAPLLAVDTEHILFGLAAAVSLAAYAMLILTPALGAFARGWEKLAAGVLSMFVLAALVLVGIAIGFYVLYNWDSISQAI